MLDMMLMEPMLLVEELELPSLDQEDVQVPHQSPVFLKTFPKNYATTNWLIQKAFSILLYIYTSRYAEKNQVTSILKAEAIDRIFCKNSLLIYNQDLF